MPMIILNSRRSSMSLPRDGSEMSIISASSDVARNTARSVPSVITPPEYKFAAKTEKPHCGIQPRSEPKSGPALPAERRALLILSPAWCSRASKSKNARNKNGSVLRLSIRVSLITSKAIVIYEAAFPFSDSRRTLRIKPCANRQP